MRGPTVSSVSSILLDKDTHLKIQISFFSHSIGVRSLRDLSLSVIVSTLLQQPSPPYGQIQDLLPDYVPPTIKKSIAHLLNSRRPIQSKWW